MCAWPCIRFRSRIVDIELAKEEIFSLDNIIVYRVQVNLNLLKHFKYTRLCFPIRRSGLISHVGESKFVKAFKIPET